MPLKMVEAEKGSLKEGICYMLSNSIPILRTMVLFLYIKVPFIYVPIIYFGLP